MHHESIPSHLPTLINTMALLLTDESRSSSTPDGLSPRLAADLRRWALSATREDAGLATIEHCLSALLDPPVRRRLRQWMSRVRRSSVFRRAVAVASEVRGLRPDSTEFGFALALLECLAAAGRRGKGVPAKRLDPPASVRRALCTMAERRQAAPDAHVAPLNDLLRRLVKEALSRFDFCEGSILLYDDERQDLFFHLSVSPVADRLAGLRVPIEGSIAGSLLHTRQASYIADVLRAGQHYGQVDRATGVRTESILGAPLLSRDRPFGVIELVNRRTSTPCRQQDIEHFARFADSARLLVEDILDRQAAIDCLVRCLRIAHRRGEMSNLSMLASAARHGSVRADVQSAFRGALAIQGIAERGPRAADEAADLLRRFCGLPCARRTPAILPFPEAEDRHG